MISRFPLLYFQHELFISCFLQFVLFICCKIHSNALLLYFLKLIKNKLTGLLILKKLFTIRILLTLQPETFLCKFFYLNFIMLIIEQLSFIFPYSSS